MEVFFSPLFPAYVRLRHYSSCGPACFVLVFFHLKKKNNHFFHIMWLQKNSVLILLSSQDFEV